MREWVDSTKRAPRTGPDTRDRRWVMRCDVEHPSGTRCATTSEPSEKQPSLSALANDGWFIAKIHGDVCPDCIARGYKPWTKPHDVMAVQS